MTNERVCANSEALPIQDWENRHVKGDALACKRVFEAHLAEVAELRQRQEQYEESLPKKPRKALAEIHRTLLDQRDISEPGYAPRAALELIYQLVAHNALDDSDQMRDAVYWLAIQGLDGLKKIETATARAQHIARQVHPMYEPYKA